MSYLYIYLHDRKLGLSSRWLQRWQLKEVCCVSELSHKFKISWSRGDGIMKRALTKTDALIMEPVPDISDTAQEMVASAKSRSLYRCEGSNPVLRKGEIICEWRTPSFPQQPTEKQPASVLTSFLPSFLSLTCVECLCFSLKHISDLPGGSLPSRRACIISRASTAPRL